MEAATSLALNMGERGKEGKWTSEDAKDKDMHLLPEPPQGTQLCQHLDLRTYDPRTIR